MSYLRFSRAEYRAVIRVCRRLDIGRYDPHTFRRILVLALADAAPDLTVRVSRFDKAEVRLLHDHLCAETKDPRRPFNPDEWRALEEACGAVPATARFVRPFQKVLVRGFRHSSPALARKLARLSVSQFARVFELVREPRRGNV